MGMPRLLRVRDCSGKPGTSKASEDLQRKARPLRGHAQIITDKLRRKVFHFLRMGISLGF
jgi:hypothetical protein